MHGNSKRALLIWGVLFIIFDTAYSMGDVCSPNPCGVNADCHPRNGRPVCICQPGHFGSPLVRCQRGECTVNEDCPQHQTCRNYHCENPCGGVCGVGADCNVRNHVPVCSCPAGYVGNPFSSCQPATEKDLCYPSPCGKNTHCSVRNGVPVCTCLPGYYGRGLTGCYPECETDYECGSGSKCYNNKCEQVCKANTCGLNARCEVGNHRAVCTCNTGYFGDPYSSCNAECESHYDCPAGRPACSAGKCIDPCAQGVCGVNANCNVKDRTTPVCSCPKHMTGDPFVSCRPFEKSDLCIPNPCGSNAQCTPGHDRTGAERPVCTCIPGYIGDALIGCTRGECLSDNECSYDRTCIANQCRPICDVGSCGRGAQCRARDHTAVCTCPEGYTGQPLVSCSPIPRPVAASYRNGRYYYLK